MCCLDSSSARDVSDTGVERGPAAGCSSVKTACQGHRTAGQGHKVPIAGHHMPSTLLSRSDTEFELECETDAVYVKCAQPAAFTSSATDLLSGGVLVASSSLNGVDDSANVADDSSVLNTSSASAMKVATEDILPHLKHKRSYNTKVFHIFYF